MMYGTIVRPLISDNVELHEQPFHSVTISGGSQFISQALVS